MAVLTLPARVTLREFDQMFKSVKNWGRWGPDDELGTMDFLTRHMVRSAAGLVRSGRQVTMAIPMNRVAGPDNPNPVIHHVVQAHDIDIASSTLTFSTDFFGLAFHGECHTHMDALCHIAYQGRVYNGRPALEVMTSRGATALDVTSYSDGLVGRGVLLDVPRFRGARWLEPGDAVTRYELEAIEQAEGVRFGEATSWSSAPATTGAGWNSARGGASTRRPVKARRACTSTRSAGRAPDRGVPAGRGRRGGSQQRRGHALSDPRLQVAAMGMFVSDSLQLEDLARACAEERRFEFMVVGLPLRLPGGTGSPWNPIAIF